MQRLTVKVLQWTGGTNERGGNGREGNNGQRNSSHGGADLSRRRRRGRPLGQMVKIANVATVVVARTQKTPLESVHPRFFSRLRSRVTLAD